MTYYRIIFFELIGFNNYDQMKLNISFREGSLIFEVLSKDDQKLRTFFLSLTPLKKIIFDYHTICESYFNAVRKLPN